VRHSKDAVNELAGKTVIDRAAVDELVRDACAGASAGRRQHARNSLGCSCRSRVKQRALDEEPPKGDGRARARPADRLPGTRPPGWERRGAVTLGPQTILMAGLQGSGKTTTTAKLARFFQRQGTQGRGDSAPIPSGRCV